MEYYYGIDFGTTNSAVYTIVATDGIKETEFSVGEDENTPLPSYVAINKTTGEVQTGLSAKKNITEDNGYEVFSSIKSIIEEDTEWNIAGKKWTPIDIAAELFNELKVKAEDTTMHQMDKAVVAVPVGLSAQKRNSIRKAAKKGWDRGYYVY